jgi:hypothetical protein
VASRKINHAVCDNSGAAPLNGAPPMTSTRTVSTAQRGLTDATSVVVRHAHLVGTSGMPPIDGQSVTGDPLQARMLEIRDALLVQAAVRLLASPSACEMLHINNSADAVKIIAEAWKRIQTPD